MRQVLVAVAVENGRARLDPFAATLPGGRVTVRGGADSTAEPPSVQVSAQAEGVDLAPMLAALRAPPRVRGRLDLDADLRGAGRDLRSVAGSLSGHLGLALVDGAFDAALLQGLPAELRRALLPQGTAGGDAIPLRCGALRLQAEAGTRAGAGAAARDRDRARRRGRGHQPAGRDLGAPAAARPARRQHRAAGAGDRGRHPRGAALRRVARSGGRGRTRRPAVPATDARPRAPGACGHPGRRRRWERLVAGGLRFPTRHGAGRPGRRACRPPARRTRPPTPFLRRRPVVARCRANCRGKRKNCCAACSVVAGRRA